MQPSFVCWRGTDTKALSHTRDGQPPALLPSSPAVAFSVQTLTVPSLLGPMPYHFPQESPCSAGLGWEVQFPVSSRHHLPQERGPFLVRVTFSSLGSLSPPELHRPCTSVAGFQSHAGAWRARLQEPEGPLDVRARGAALASADPSVIPTALIHEAQASATFLISR